MKGLLAGVCAGGVVSVVGLAIGLTIVPPRDPAAVGRGDRPDVVSPLGAAPDADVPTIFAEEPEVDVAEPDLGTAPTDEAEEMVGAGPAASEDLGGGDSAAQDEPAPATVIRDARQPDVAADTGVEQTAEGEDAEAAQTGGVEPGSGENAAEIVPPDVETGSWDEVLEEDQAPVFTEPTSNPGADTAAEPAADGGRGEEADLGSGGGADGGAPAGEAASLKEDDRTPTATVMVSPTAQVVAPQAPAADAVQDAGTRLLVKSAASDARDVLEAQPAALALPLGGFEPPPFDVAVPPRTAPPLQNEGLPQAEAAPADADATAEDDEAADIRPALVRNAAAEPPSGDIPLLALVLVDRPGAEVIDEVPLSVAIAADAADAGARATAWRAAGAEIVAIPGLTADADGTGPLAVFDATFDALPRATAVMAESTQGFAGGPVAADEIAATLVETGHGLIVRGRELGPVAQAAERAGVPTERIFRRVDGSGRDGRAIGRFLDQAAFEARSRGAVVVIAETSPETAEGIAHFLDSSRADTVELVPVSTILRRE